MGPKGFLFFETYWNLMEDLSDQRFGAFVKAACRYVFNGIEPTFKDKKLNALWGVVTPSLNNSIKRSKAGTKGMESRYNKTANKTPNKPDNKPDNKTPNEKEKEKEEEKEEEKEKEKEKKEEKKKEEKKEHTHTQTREDEIFSETEKEADAEFRPPTLDEVKAYCKAEGLTFNVERFINNYECKGWVVGKSPIRSWKAAARLWQSQ